MNKKIIFLSYILIFTFIFSGCGIETLNDSRAKARDMKRLANIKTIQSALEIYNDDNGQYPETLEDLRDGKAVYLSVIPKNPIEQDGECPSNYQYSYKMKDNGADYEVYFCLGNERDGVSGGMNIAAPHGIFSSK